MKIQAITGINNFKYSAKVTPKKNNATQSYAITLPAYKDAKSFVNMNFNINFKGKIHAYAANENWEGIQEELSNGVDINTQDEYGSTALMKASSIGHTGIIEKLLEKGAKVDVQDKYGWTALMEASSYGQTGAAKKLLEKGADVKIKDKDWWTALVHASKFGHTDTVEKLLENGAEINAQSKKGWTALMYASSYGHKDTVEKLLQHPDIDINIQNNEGKTALDLAIEEGNTEIVEMINQYKFNKSIKEEQESKKYQGKPSKEEIMSATLSRLAERVANL